MTSPTLRVNIETPPWLTEHAVTIKETADLFDANADTIHGWIRISKAMGHLIPVKRRHRLLLTPHNVFVVAVLVALAKSGVPISESIIRRAIAVTHQDGQPVLPGLFDVAEFAEIGTDGQPVARIYVELSAVWFALEPKLAKLMEPAIA